MRSFFFVVVCWYKNTRLGLLMWQDLVTGDRNRHAVLYLRWQWLALYIYTIYKYT
jgi:hypothetical protein